MRKITLDFRGLPGEAELTRREIHEYIAGKMSFPAYYGHNLDALYDCLTDITEPTAVGIVAPMLPQDPEEALSMECAAAGREGKPRRGKDFDALNYFVRVRKTFADAEADNPNLAVFDLMKMEDAGGINIP